MWGAGKNLKSGRLKTLTKAQALTVCGKRIGRNFLNRQHDVTTAPTSKQVMEDA